MPTKAPRVTEPPSPTVVVVEPEEEPQVGGEADQAEVARAALLELLSKMGLEDTQVEARWTEPSEGEGEPLLRLDVNSPTEVLIGPRGETLTALQFITRLIVGREQGGRARLVVDVNGYKVRRERKLRQLAQRLAQQAVDTDRTVVLEPMAPYERRIVHLALRDHPKVTTHSIGEGNHRKVTIIPRLE
jgi:spoIIIJ-associated protein